MLLLLILGSVSMVAAEYVQIQNQTVLNISSCPITFYEVEYKALYVDPNVDLSVCFGDFSATNCIKFQNGGSNLWSFQVIHHLNESSEARYNSLALKEKGVYQLDNFTCAVELTMVSSNVTQNLIIPNAGLIMLLVGVFKVEKNNLLKVTVDTNEMMSELFANGESELIVGGCRGTQGTPLNLLQTLLLNASTCSSEFCSQTGSVLRRCQTGEKCKDATCVPWEKYTCAVTGNTMIDRMDQTRAIVNFCPRVLLKNQYLNLTASFAARRLSDVPLLSHVVFEIADQVISIKNGVDKVKATNQYINITRVPGGYRYFVEKDDFIAEMFDDGTTLHINYEGSPEHVDGLHMCANNSELITRAVAGCDQVDSDARGDSIDCGAATERCETLFQTAFKSCSVDTGPYIAACTNLFCNYTDTDNMMCSVLGAYARSCPDEDWMDSVGCAPSECVDGNCLDHEFCGLSSGRRPVCLCRAPFAAPYRLNNTFGEDTMCVNKKASVSLVGCLLAEKNINMSSLHLNNPNCTGTTNPKTKRVTFTFSDTEHCAANVSVNGNKIIYSNTIVAPEDNGDTITRSSPVRIQFSCTYSQPEVHTMSLKIKDRSVVKVIDEGEWTYVFNMTAFLDQNLNSPLNTKSELHLDQQLWIETKVSEVDGQLISLVIEKCWATEEKDPAAGDKYSLVKNGCSDEESVKIQSNGESLASVFSFRVFQFVGSEDEVYIHCETKLCIKADGCTKTCNPP